MDNDKKLNDEESLKAENDFLKIKIMLEHGTDIQYSWQSKRPAQSRN